MFISKTSSIKNRLVTAQDKQRHAFFIAVSITNTILKYSKNMDSMIHDYFSDELLYADCEKISFHVPQK